MLRYFEPLLFARSDKCPLLSLCVSPLSSPWKPLPPISFHSPPLTSHHSLPFHPRFMAHHALHQVIEDSRDSVVLVFLEDVQDYKLSRCLLLRRGMLRPNCLLNWPLQRERVPAFHQRLRIALGTTNRVQ